MVNGLLQGSYCCYSEQGCTTSSVMTTNLQRCNEEVHNDSMDLHVRVIQSETLHQRYGIPPIKNGPARYVLCWICSKEQGCSEIASF